jgi:hypothetical protein
MTFSFQFFGSLAGGAGAFFKLFSMNAASDKTIPPSTIPQTHALMKFFPARGPEHHPAAASSMFSRQPLSNGTKGLGSKVVFLLPISFYFRNFVICGIEIIALCVQNPFL